MNFSPDQAGKLACNCPLGPIRKTSGEENWNFTNHRYLPLHFVQDFSPWCLVIYVTTANSKCYILVLTAPCWQASKRKNLSRNPSIIQTSGLHHYKGKNIFNEYCLLILVYFNVSIWRHDKYPDDIRHLYSCFEARGGLTVASSFLIHSLNYWRQLFLTW